jgi:hypothetical protein
LLSPHSPPSCGWADGLRPYVLRSLVSSSSPPITYSPQHPTCSLLSLIARRATCRISSNSPLPCHDKARLRPPQDAISRGPSGSPVCGPTARCLLLAGPDRPYRFRLRPALSLLCERAARRYWCDDDDGSRFPLSACVHTLASRAARPLFISARHCLRRCCAARGTARVPPALPASRLIVFISLVVFPSAGAGPDSLSARSYPCTASRYRGVHVLAARVPPVPCSSPPSPSPVETARAARLPPPPHARSLALSHLASGHSGVCGLAAHVPITDGNVEVGAAGATMDLDSLIPPPRTSHPRTLAPASWRSPVLAAHRPRTV